MQQTVTQIGNYSYYPDKIIGQGATGSVYMGFRNNDRHPVAVKVIRLKEINTAVKKHLLDCEVAALSAVKNKYICQIYDILKDSQYYFIPMEYIPNGTLREYIKKRVKLSENEALRMFQKILQGYLAIRKAGFIHRDLKSQNILLRANMDPVIIDFGYAEKVQTQGQRMSYNVGSPAYMSPQAYNESQYGQKSDVWALGIVFHEMLTGTIPIMRTSDVDEYFRYLKNMKTAEIIRGQQNQICTNLLLHALTVDTRLRYSAEQLQNQMKSQNGLNSPTRSKGGSSNLDYPQMQKPHPILNKTFSNIETTGNTTFTSPENKYNNENQHEWSVRVQRKNSDSCLWSGSNLQVSNFRKLTTDSPTVQMRETMPAQGYSNLRKRVLNNNFNINLVPVRSNVPSNNDSSPMIYPQVGNPEVRKQPMTPNIVYNSSQSSQPPKLKKTYSYNNINVSPIRHF